MPRTGRVRAPGAGAAGCAAAQDAEAREVDDHDASLADAGFDHRGPVDDAGDLGSEAFTVEAELSQRPAGGGRQAPVMPGPLDLQGVPVGVGETGYENHGAAGRRAPSRPGRACQQAPDRLADGPGCVLQSHRAPFGVARGDQVEELQ